VAATALAIWYNHLICQRASISAYLEWAERERAGDLNWIMENVDVFWPAAQLGFEELGRGALVVDITRLPVEGGGHPFGYFPQQMFEQEGDQDTRRLVREYEPHAEFVTVLFKTRDRVSSYRLRGMDSEPREQLGSRVERRQSSNRARNTQQPPDIEVLMAWEMEGYCEATDGCVVEPDGRCTHGNRSWLLELGLI
jgi:hypothetical protein